MSSAWEHFFAATSMLASNGPIKHRLVEAYRVHLATLDAEEVPKEIREEFSSLSNCMSSRSVPVPMKLFDHTGMPVRSTRMTQLSELDEPVKPVTT